MVKKGAVPDAWDDDWEAQADRDAAAEVPAKPAADANLTKTERLARHAETNRKLWESAETPQTFHYLEASNQVPAATTNFKPQVKVLSRKPVLAKRGDPAGGLAQLSLDDDEEDDSAKKAQLTPEERRAKQKRDLEEKQRRYEEARAKIFGESAPSSGASTPGTVTPPRGGEGFNPSPRGRGRGRGGRGNMNNNTGASEIRQQTDGRRQGFQTGSSRELYDPGYAPKPDTQRRMEDGSTRSGIAFTNEQQQAIRAPRGPDGSGRGGFGFARGRGRES